MLVDTSGLLAAHNAKEPFHQQALQFLRSRNRRITHSYILSEFVALAHVRGLPREPTLELVHDIGQGKYFTVWWIDQSLHDEALDLLFHRLDKAYSLCDAVSFILMRDQGITEALTTDHHFEQEGFTRLLK